MAPGWILSSGMDTYTGDMAEKVIPSMAQHVPLQRMGTESEVSSAIVYLLSEASKFISGVTIRIDGGASLGTRIFPLSTAKNNDAYDGFHRSFLPDVIQKLKK